MRLSAVILAGGRSSRMGRDKALLPVPGYTCLLDRQLTVVRELGPVELLVSCRPEQMLPVSAGARRVFDDGSSGPLGGIVAALQAMRGDALLVLGVDLARMTADLLRRVAGGAAFDGSIGAVPRHSGGIEPLASMWPQRTLTLAREHLERSTELSLRAFAQAATKQKLVRWFEIAGCDRWAFANWNRSSDAAVAATHGAVSLSRMTSPASSR